MRILMTLALVIALAAPAAAQEIPAAEAVDTPAGFVVGVHVGPSFSAFSPLKTTVLPRLEIGAALPFLGKRLQLFAVASYQAPKAEGEAEDIRVGGLTFSYELTQKELMLGLGLNVRILELGRPVNPYVAVGPQVFLLETVANGNADGAEFGENRETDTKVGLYAGIGVEFRLGPGALFAQMGFTWCKLDGLITGVSNTGALNPTVGYRLIL